MELFRAKTSIKPLNLDGLSNDLIEEHFSLYEKYINQTNKLLALEKKLREGEQNFSTETLRIDLLKQISFERNGVFLHEAYFQNLKSGVNFNQNGNFSKLCSTSFNSIDDFLNDIRTVCKFRGIGWCLTTWDTTAKVLRNSIIESHEHYATFGNKLLLCIDLWEHSFIRDYSATERNKYVETVIKNINWKVLDKRSSGL